MTSSRLFFHKKCKLISQSPVHALSELNGMHQRSKIQGGAFEGKIRMSAIFRTKHPQKMKKGGLIYPTLLSYLVSKEKII